MPNPVLACAQSYPLLGAGLAGFLVMLCLCAVPRFRNWLLPRLQIPLPSTKQHLLPIDSFRGIAAIWVALYHADQWAAPVFRAGAGLFPPVTVGHYGVQIFVILSGMLIFRSLRGLRGLDQLRTYFIRRFLRIYPLYLAVSVVFLVLFPPKFGAAVSELFMFRALGYPTFMNPVAWSVYVEVLFYIVMPAFMLLASKRPALAAAVVFSVLLLGERSGGRELALWKFFFLGVLCSEGIDRVMTWRGKHVGAGIFAAGLGLVALAVFSALRGGGLGYIEREVALGIGGCLVIAGTVSNPWLRAAFSLRPFRVLGTVSYSIYLLHPLLLITSFGVRFSPNAQEIIARAEGLAPMAAPDLFLVYMPALIFFSCCTFIAIERPMLRLRPKVATAPIVVVQKV